MGANGAPARAVTLSGMDYGKVLEMIQIRYLPNYVIGQNLLTVLNLFGTTAWRPSQTSRVTTSSGRSSIR
jgi:hypothetical protein